MLRTTIIAPMIPILLYLKNEKNQTTPEDQYKPMPWIVHFKALWYMNNNNVSLGSVTWQLLSYNNVHVILENNNKWSICEWKKQI